MAPFWSLHVYQPTKWYFIHKEDLETLGLGEPAPGIPHCLGWRTRGGQRGQGVWLASSSVQCTLRSIRAPIILTPISELFVNSHGPLVSLKRNRQGMCLMGQQFIRSVKLCVFLSVLKDYYIYQY